MPYVASSESVVHENTHRFVCLKLKTELYDYQPNSGSILTMTDEASITAEINSKLSILMAAIADLDQKASDKISTINPASHNPYALAGRFCREYSKLERQRISLAIRLEVLCGPEADPQQLIEIECGIIKREIITTVKEQFHIEVQRDKIFTELTRIRDKAGGHDLPEYHAISMRFCEIVISSGRKEDQKDWLCERGLELCPDMKLQIKKELRLLANIYTESG